MFGMGCSQTFSQNGIIATFFCLRQRTAQGEKGARHVSSQERDEQVFCIEELPNEHVAAVDGLAVLHVHLLGPLVQDEPQSGVRGHSDGATPQNLPQQQSLPGSPGKRRPELVRSFKSWILILRGEACGTNPQIKHLARH